MAHDKTDDDPMLIKLHARRHQLCWWCHKPGNQEKLFSKRLTPLLRTADGRRHNEQTMMAELEDDVAVWKVSPLLHPQCLKEAAEEMLAVIDQLDADAERWREVEIKLIERSSDPAVRQLMQEIGLGIEDQPPRV